MTTDPTPELDLEAEEALIASLGGYTTWRADSISSDATEVEFSALPIWMQGAYALDEHGEVQVVTPADLGQNWQHYEQRAHQEALANRGTIPNQPDLAARMDLDHGPHRRQGRGQVNLGLGLETVSSIGELLAHLSDASPFLARARESVEQAAAAVIHEDPAVVVSPLSWQDLVNAVTIQIVDTVPVEMSVSVEEHTPSATQTWEITLTPGISIRPVRNFSSAHVFTDEQLARVDDIPTTIYRELCLLLHRILHDVLDWLENNPELPEDERAAWAWAIARETEMRRALSRIVAQDHIAAMDDRVARQAEDELAARRDQRRAEPVDAVAQAAVDAELDGRASPSDEEDDDFMTSISEAIDRADDALRDDEDGLP